MRLFRAAPAAVLLLTASLCPAGDAAVAPRADWPAQGGDPGASRYSQLTQVSERTVSHLGGAWRTSLEGGVSKAAPVVVDGVMYITSSKAVLALDAATGAVRWRHEPRGGGLLFNTKGVAVAAGSVFVGLADARVLALDAATGEPRWTAQVAKDQAVKLITAAPAVAEGVVVVSVSGGDIGGAGRVVGLDAATGKELWHFSAVAPPGAPGHETWPQNSDVWQRGGGAVWMTASIDTELGLAIIGIGNPSPPYGGEAREGDNLYTSSAVALDLKTGALRWHFQAVHHDIWDYDLGTPLVLYDAKVDRRNVKGVAVMRTDGVLFQLDRATGKPLTPVEERKMKQNARLRTAPTQPFPVGVQQVGRACVDPEMIPVGFVAGCFFDPVDVGQPNMLVPFATVRSAPMAYSPRTGYFYVAGGVSATWQQRGEDPGYYRLGKVPGIQSYGLLAALDPKTGRIVWEKRLPYSVFNGSGATVTAGNLVFHGDLDGTLQAYRATDGELMWKFQTGAAAEGPVVTYEAGGHQHVAIVATDAVWGFRLGGTVPQGAAPPPQPTVTGFSGRIVRSDHVTFAAKVGDMLADLGIGGASNTRVDEYAMEPMRVKIAAGSRLVFTNAGNSRHEAVAKDGSWSSGPIAPGESASVLFERPGTYPYVCKDHPWSIGEIVVE